MFSTVYLLGLCVLACDVVGFKSRIDILGPDQLKKMKSCSAQDEYECDNGQCILKYSFCDGIIDCLDGSDESPRLCANTTNLCPNNTFWRCDYGGCIRNFRRCDYNIDCWDGTDEDISMSRDPCPWPPFYEWKKRENNTDSSTETPGVRNHVCKLPEPAEDRQFSVMLSSLKQLLPGSSVPHDTVLIVTCDPGYSFRLSEERQTISKCIDGKWEKPIRRCFKLCPPLPPNSADMRCSSTNCRSAGTVVQCTKSSGHKPFKTTCDYTGQWSGPFPQCEPGCGISSLDTSNGPPAAINQKFETGYFPWTALVYIHLDEGWSNISLGTLITPRIVITSAHSIEIKSNSTEIFRKPDYYFHPYQGLLYQVALGKQYQGWNITEDTEQRFNVSNIVFHHEYGYNRSIHQNDLALLILKGEAKISASVMPPCIDFSKSHPKDLGYQKGNFGYINGWREEGEIYNSSHNPSEPETGRHPLVYSHVPVYTYEECNSKLKGQIKDDDKWITLDTVCVEVGGNPDLYRFGGSGLTIPFRGRHYFFGVHVSHHTTKDNRAFGVVADIYYHMQWLKKEVASLSNRY